MSTSKHIDRICAVITLLAVLLTLLFMNGAALGLEAVVDEDAEAYAGSARFTANDLNGSWDASNATAIRMEGGGGAVSGGGAYYYDGNLVITNGGWYVLSGTLEDGYISVDAYSSSKVWILLEGAAVRCTDNACFRVEQADKVFLTLAEGTENSFTSGETYSEAALADGTGGAVFAHDDLTINGSGSLAISAGYKHGIDANDALVITGGTISVTCPQDGLHVNDAFCLTGAALTVSAGDDGIHSDTSIYIEGGTLLVSESYEGLEAPVIEIAGGDTTIYASDDGINANGGSGNMFGGFGGGFGGGQMDMGSFDFSSFDPSQFNGERPEDGSFDFSSFDPSQFDGERPEDGDFDFSSFDPSQSGGGAPQMPEGVTASESVASENDETEETVESCFRMSGGTLTIINENARDADGIDSNGSIYITGGSIRVSMSNGGYSLDVGSESGGVMEISGGDLIGCGSYDMAESFDSSSAQPSILYTYSAGAEAGTTVALEDTEGNVLISYTAPCAFTSVNLSCPEMEIGGTYLMVIGDNVEEITLTETSASFGDARSGGFGGTMNFGGMQPRGGTGGMRPGESGGGFGRGGRNMAGQRDSGKGSAGEETAEQPEFGGMPPEQDGEMPEWDGEQPEFGGTPPEQDSEMPEWDGERPEFGGMPPEQNGEMPEWDGEQPEFGAAPPEQNGDMPEWDGEQPEFGSTPPEQNGEMPEWDGERPEFGGMPPEQNGDMPEWNGEQPEFGSTPPDFGGDMTAFGGERRGWDNGLSEEENNSTEAAAADSKITAETWIWLGISAAVLLAGIAFGMSYTRRKH